MPTTTNNPSLSFKFGLQTDLKEGAPLTPGTIYVTTDERTMWVDLPVGNETKRFRLGDFISYRNRDALVSDYENWNSSTFAYIEDINTLAKYNSTEKKWVDVNNFNLIQSLDTRVGYAETKGEDGTVTSAATGLFKKIKDEETRATTKEGALETSINSLDDRTTELENKVGSDKDGDKEATGLYKLIADEVTRATEAESDINDEIGDKGNDSGIEATTLWAAIQEVAANAGSSEASVIALITAEAEAREAADIILQENIEAEARARAEADNELNNKIDTTKTGLEEKINKDISDEAAEREASDEALRESLTNYIENSFAVADAMTFKGVITTIADLPTGEADDEGNNKVLVNAGDTYKIGAMIDSSDTPDEQVWYIGDLIIAKADQGKDDTSYTGGWYHISSGFEDDYTSYFDVDEANDTITLKNGAEQSNGKIKFEVPAGGSSSLNVNVSKGSTTDNRAQESTVSINLVWGTF